MRTADRLAGSTSLLRIVGLLLVFLVVVFAWATLNGLRPGVPGIAHGLHTLSDRVILVAGFVGGFAALAAGGLLTARLLGLLFRERAVYAVPEPEPGDATFQAHLRASRLVAEAYNLESRESRAKAGRAMIQQAKELASSGLHADAYALLTEIASWYHTSADPDLHSIGAAAQSILAREQPSTRQK